MNTALPGLQYRRIRLEVDVAAVAWVIALLFFGVGDVATTIVGFHVGAVEGNPALAGLGEPSVAFMIGAKALVFGVAYAAYRRATVATWSVPASLATLGTCIVVWNTLVVGSIVF